MDRLLMIVVAAVIATSPGIASDAPAAEGGDDLRAATQNPVGAMISLPFKSSWDFGAPNGTAYFLNIQPVIPQTVSKWNLIHRVIAPIVSVEGFISGRPEIPVGTPGDGATGLGDINYSVYLSPAAPGKVIWGVGPSFMLSTATDDQLGSGKWSAGPTAVVLTQPKPWTLGILGRQLWSYAGDADRPDVNQLLLEPFVNYNLAGGWYLITDMVMTANWDAPSGNQWTVPLGGGIGKIFRIGNQAMNPRIEAYNNVEKPKGGPDWVLSWTLQFLFPR